MIVSGMIKSHANDEYRREQGGSPLEFQRDSAQRCADLASKRFHTEQSFCSLSIIICASPAGHRRFPTTLSLAGNPRTRFGKFVGIEVASLVWQCRQECLRLIRSDN
jgi:hypothetical protein